MTYLVTLFNFAVLISSLTANDDLTCPFNAKGTHPKCICNSEQPYDEVNRICSTVLDAQYLLAKCPKGSEGTFPACICGDGKVYVPERDECVIVDKSQCPAGSKKVNNKCICDNVNDFKYEFDEVFWICRPWYIPTTRPPPTPCPPHQHRISIGDECEWDRCPAGYISKTGYWPDCQAPPTCQQKGMIGEYPNCYARVIEQHCNAHQSGIYPDCHWQPCPHSYISSTGYWPDCEAPPSCYDVGMIGIYPNCVTPPPKCPPYHHRNSDGECVPIPCPPGHEGDFQPNCKIVPKCPPEYPGTWPNCNIYATTPRDHITTTQRVTTTPRITTTPRVTTTPRITTTPRVTTTTTKRTTTPQTTTEKITTTTAKTTTTTKYTTPKPGKCFCDCYSDEIVVFKNNVVRDPARKYKRYINEKTQISDKN